MQDAVVTVFGGSGFIGRHVIRRLAQRGAMVRVVTRDPDRAGSLRPLGDVGQIVLVKLEEDDETAIAEATGAATHVVNLIGILHERRSGDFQRVHAELAGTIAAQAAAVGARAFVHLSAIGADEGAKSAYAASKGKGEAAVRQNFANATILRPSIVFGPGDGFFARFGEMAAVSPFLPLIDGGKTRFQPVYVGDVADAVMGCLFEPRPGIFELGGPEVHTFKELLEYLIATLDRPRMLLPVPSGLLGFPARVMEYLPDPPLTRDQLVLLQSDNVVGEGAKTLLDLGIAATPMEVIVPGYLRAFGRKRVPSPVT